MAVEGVRPCCHHGIRWLVANHASVPVCPSSGAADREVHQLPAPGVPRQNAARQDHTGLQVRRHAQRW